MHLAAIAMLAAGAVWRDTGGYAASPAGAREARQGAATGRRQPPIAATDAHSAGGPAASLLLGLRAACLCRGLVGVA